MKNHISKETSGSMEQIKINPKYENSAIGAQARNNISTYDDESSIDIAVLFDESTYEFKYEEAIRHKIRQFYDAIESFKKEVSIKDSEKTFGNATIHSLNILNDNIYIITDNAKTLTVSKSQIIGLNEECSQYIGKRLFCPDITNPTSTTYATISITYEELEKRIKRELQAKEYINVTKIQSTTNLFPELKQYSSGLSLLLILRTILKIGKVFKAQSQMDLQSRIQIYNITKEYITNCSLNVNLNTIQSIIKTSTEIHKINSTYLKHLIKHLGGTVIQTNPKILEYPHIANNHILKSHIYALNKNIQIDQGEIINNLKQVISYLGTYLGIIKEPNAYIVEVRKKCFYVKSGLDYSNTIRCSYKSLVDLNITNKIGVFSGKPIGIYALINNNGKNDTVFISEIVDVLPIGKHFSNLKKLIENNNYVYARRYFNCLKTMIHEYLTPNVSLYLNKVHKSLKTAKFNSQNLPALQIKFCNKTEILADIKTTNIMSISLSNVPGTSE